MTARILSRFSPCLAMALALAWIAAPAASRADTVVYNNINTRVGFQANGGATSATGNTAILADDILFAAGYAGSMGTSFILEVGNSTSTAATANITAEFFATDGANGGPGTLLGSTTLTGVILNGGVTPTTFSGTNLFTIPTNGKIWAGFYFTGVSGDLATLNSLGAEVENGGTVGSSSASTFFTNTVPATTGSNPSGSIGANPNVGQPANLGITIAVPEPSSVWLTAIGGAGLVGWMVRRRKMGRA